MAIETNIIYYLKTTTKMLFKFHVVKYFFMSYNFYVVSYCLMLSHVT